MNKQCTIILSLVGLIVFNFTFCTKATLEETTPPPTDSLLTVTYTNDIAPLFQANCTPCHFGSNPTASVDLNDYASTVFAVENQQLLNAITNNSNPMPPSGLMSEQNRALVTQWVDDQMPEN